MKPFVRMILVTTLALAAGCASIERTGEYYVATKTIIQKGLTLLTNVKGPPRGVAAENMV